MSNPSIDELLAWMQDNSQTCGWGALIAYDRRKTNDLLQQLYIERFTSGHYLPLINKSENFEKTIEHLSGLKFTVPLMSFDNASLNDSKVKLSLDFVGGMIVTEEKGLGISKVQKVLPLNRPQLTMTQPLHRVPGIVDEDGLVALNLANKQGADFKATFMLGSLDQIEMGARFRQFFENELSDDQRIFPIGTLAGETNEALTPAGFEIRTMAAPGAKVRGAPNEGDGAVLVLARMKDRDGGFTPGAEFMYPIPADANGKVYTGTVWISSRTLFDDLIKADAESDIGFGIKLAPVKETTDKVWALAGTEGGVNYPKLQIWREMGNHESAEIHADYNYIFAGATPFTLSIKDRALNVSWSTSLSTSYYYLEVKSGWPDDEKWGQMHYAMDAGLTIVSRLDEQGLVHFERTDQFLALSFRADQELNGFTHTDNHTGNSYLTNYLDNKIRPSFTNFLTKLTVPSVDTFLIRNLLFPGHNALQPTDVYTPGDLVLFGHIDPLRTSATATPQHATLEAGGSQQFSLGADVSGVTWTVRGTDPDDDGVGTVSASGLYRAPAAGPLFKGYLVAVVTGRGTLDGQEVQSSAMVTVLATTVAANPVFQICAAGGKVELSAETMAGEPLWSLKDPALGGSLSTTQGNTCTYTAGSLDSSRDLIYLDTVVAANQGSDARAECLVLVRNTYQLMDVVISEHSVPSSGQVRLQIMERGIAYNPDEYGATCRVLIGGGSISADGVYKQEADASGFAVVLIEVDDQWDTMSGYMVLPLPLDKYEDVIRRVGDSLRLAAGQKAPGA